MKISLLFLFLAITVGCSSEEKPTSTDLRFAEVILEKGGKFTIDNLREIKRLDQLPERDFEITGVDFNGTKINDVDLEAISGLRNIQVLGLHSTFITDQSMLAIKNFSKLKELEISYTQITNESVQYLIQLKNLKKLFISGTEIIDDGLGRLKTELPNCKLINLQTKNK